MLWRSTYVIVFYRDRKETNRRCLTVDAASAYDRRRHRTSRFLAPHVQVFIHAIPQMAVDRGDLMQKIVGVRVSGEMLSLVNTINNMMDQLVIFGYEVKKVAREVGMEGKLRVQAEVGNVHTFIPTPRSVLTIWHFWILGQHHCREFDDSSQGLRTDICSSYGDSTRFIMVEASSEMDWLKTQINQMVFNLWDSIQKNMAARLRSSLTGARASS